MASRSFLDNSDRIVASAYMPTDNDILQARLPTLGIQEYRIEFGNPSKFPVERW